MYNELKFKTIRNIISQVLGRRIPPGGVETMLREMEVRGTIQGKELALISAIITYLDEKESSQQETSSSAKIEG